MNAAVRLVIRLYRLLTVFYPRPFREAFAEEMQAVFVALVGETARRGGPALVALCLKELGGLLVGLVREHLLALWRAVDRLQVAIVVILVVLTPVAMMFTPYQRIYTDGVYQAPHSADPLYSIRAILIVVGLLAPIVCLGCTLAILATGPLNAARAVFQCSLTLLAGAIGWRCFPYWVNGVFQASVGQVPMADFDPKALIPGVWLGNVWLAGVLLLYPAVWLGGGCLLVAAGLAARQQGWRLAGLTVVVVAITLGTFLVTPRYGWWLMD